MRNSLPRFGGKSAEQEREEEEEEELPAPRVELETPPSSGWLLVPSSRLRSLALLPPPGTSRSSPLPTLRPRAKRREGGAGGRPQSHLGHGAGVVEAQLLW